MHHSLHQNNVAKSSSEGFGGAVLITVPAKEVQGRGVLHVHSLEFFPELEIEQIKIEVDALAIRVRRLESIWCTLTGLDDPRATTHYERGLDGIRARWDSGQIDVRECAARLKERRKRFREEEEYYLAQLEVRDSILKQKS